MRRAKQALFTFAEITTAIMEVIRMRNFRKMAFRFFAAICVLAGCLFGTVRYVAEVLIGRHDDEIMDV